MRQGEPMVCQGCSLDFKTVDSLRNHERSDPICKTKIANLVSKGKAAELERLIKSLWQPLMKINGVEFAEGVVSKRVRAFVQCGICKTKFGDCKNLTLHNKIFEKGEDWADLSEADKQRALTSAMYFARKPDFEKKYIIRIIQECEIFCD